MGKAYSLISEVDKFSENPITLKDGFLFNSKVYRVEINSSIYTLKIAVAPRIKFIRWIDDVNWNRLEREREALR